MKESDIPPAQQKVLEALNLLRAGKNAEAAARAEEALKSGEISSAYEILGVSKARLGDLNKAIEALNKAANLEPNRLSPAVHLGNAYLAGSRLEEARAQFERVLARSPEDADAHQGLGLIYEQEGKVQDAIRHLEIGVQGQLADVLGVKVNLGRLYNAEKQFPKTVELLAMAVPNQTNVTAHELLAIAYLGLNRFQEAISTYEKAFAIAPSEVIAFGLGVTCRNAKDYPKALQHFTYVIAKRPDWSPAFFQLGETFMAMGDTKAALVNFEKASAFSTDPEPSQTRIAEVHLKQKEYARAISLLEPLTEQPNVRLEAYDRLAAAYRLNNQIPQVEKTFQKARAKYPFLPWPAYQLGLFYSSENRLAEALAQFQKASELDPKNLAFRRSYSVALRASGQKEKAVQVAREMASENPTLPEPRLYLASLYSADGRDDLAADVYRSVLKIEPDQVIALNNLALALGRLGQFAEAENYAQRAASAAPKSGQLLDTLGWVLYLKGDTAKAAQTLKQANTMTPNDPSILYHLAMAMVKENQKKPALAAFERAVSLSKSFPEYDQSVGMIRKLASEMQ